MSEATWTRLHYTASLLTGVNAEGIIDVLGDTYSYSTWVAIRRAQPNLDYREPIELTRLGEGDGSLAVDSDPRTEEHHAETTIKAIKKHPTRKTRDP